MSLINLATWYSVGLITLILVFKFTSLKIKMEDLSFRAATTASLLLAMINLLSWIFFKAFPAVLYLHIVNAFLQLSFVLFVIKAVYASSWEKTFRMYLFGIIIPLTIFAGFLLLAIALTKFGGHVIEI